MLGASIYTMSRTFEYTVKSFQFASQRAVCTRVCTAHRSLTTIILCPVSSICLTSQYRRSYMLWNLRMCWKLKPKLASRLVNSAVPYWLPSNSPTATWRLTDPPGAGCGLVAGPGAAPPVITQGALL
jgi:hypothetical protein